MNASITGIVGAVALLLGTSTAAFSQVSSSRASSRPSGAVYFLPFNSASALVPGVGLGFETMIGTNTAAFVNATYLGADLPEGLETSARNNSDLVVETGWGYNVAGGIRYYALPDASTWYGAASVGYSTANADIEYKDNTDVSADVDSVVPALAAGYRWKWGSDWNLRAGVSANFNGVVRKDIKAKEDSALAAEAVKKTEDMVETNFLAGLDLGIGYSF